MKANKKWYGVWLSLLLCTFAIGLAVTPASANPLFKGTFTITSELHWGKAVLPPGDYSLTLDHSNTMMISDARTNKAVAIELTNIVENNARDHDSKLRIVGAEGQRYVYSVRLAGYGEVFHSEDAYAMARKASKGRNVEEAVVILGSQTAGK